MNATRTRIVDMSSSASMQPGGSHASVKIGVEHSPPRAMVCATASPNDDGLHDDGLNAPVRETIAAQQARQRAQQTTPHRQGVAS